MAIAHSSTVPNTDSASTLTFTTTVAGTDAGLVVKINWRSFSTTVVSVVWDAAGVNESLVRLGSRVNTSNANATIFYLANPTAKSADVTVTMSGSGLVAGSATVYTGVDQTNMFRTAANASSTGSDDSPTVDVVALNGEWAIDSMGQCSAGPDSVSSNDHTLRHDSAETTGGGDDLRSCSQDVASSGATETMGWTLSGSDDWAIMAGALQPATASPATVPPQQQVSAVL